MAQQPFALDTIATNNNEHSQRSRSKHRSKKASNDGHSISRSKSQKPSKQKIHSSNVHETFESKSEAKSEDLFDYVHELINGSIPCDKEASKLIERLKSLENKAKEQNNQEALKQLEETITEKEKIVKNDLEFKSMDKNLYLRHDDICCNVLNARNAYESLESISSKSGKYDKSIENVEISNKVVKFTYNKAYRVYLFIYSKQQMKQLPHWCKTPKTKAGMYI